MYAFLPSITATCWTSFMGFEALLTAEVTITDFGSPARTYGPPELCFPAEGPEYEIDSLTLQIDTDQLGAPHQATEALLETLCSGPSLHESILSAIGSYEPPEYEYDEDYYRGR